MPAATNQRYPVQDRKRFALPELISRVGTRDPFAVIGVPVDRERSRRRDSIDERADQVRMRNGNGADPAAGTDGFNGGIIEQAGAIPQHVSVRGLDEQGALSNGKAWGGANAGELGSTSSMRL